jgi:hypothetical protein
VGAWAYCQHHECGMPMEPPTVAEVVNDSWVCQRGHLNQLGRNAFEDAVVRLEERVDAMEERLNRLESRDT